LSSYCETRQYDAIQRILNDIGASQIMGRKGKALMQQKFSWSQNAVEMANIYAEVLDAKN